MLGENGTGKTTFIRMLAGLLKSDEQVCFLHTLLRLVSASDRVGYMFRLLPKLLVMRT